MTAAPGGVVYALRSSYAAPPHPVRIDPDGTVTPLPCVEPPALPGSLTEITAHHRRRHRGAVVAGAARNSDAPAPLAALGPRRTAGQLELLALAVESVGARRTRLRGAAAGPGAVDRLRPGLHPAGLGHWGGAPYDDLMAATDAACADPRIDASRTAAMGGSFGGYMANWIAGHTDRFDAIVTHASLWALDQFNSTTDAAYYWLREMTRDMATANSPHRFVEEIRTPMLVIHGDKDYRVPIGEALRLWYELLSESGLPAADDGTSPHRFLYFPSENHWVLSPQHAKIWYQVVIAFLPSMCSVRTSSCPRRSGSVESMSARA